MTNNTDTSRESVARRDIIDRLADVTGFIRFETGHRVAAAGCLAEEAIYQIKRLRAERDAALADRWQPMETAPKDTPVRIKIPSNQDYHGCQELLAINVNGTRWHSFAWAMGRDLDFEPLGWMPLPSASDQPTPDRYTDGWNAGIEAATQECVGHSGYLYKQGLGLECCAAVASELGGDIRSLTLQEDG